MIEGYSYKPVEVVWWLVIITNGICWVWCSDNDNDNDETLVIIIKQVFSKLDGGGEKEAERSALSPQTLYCKPPFFLALVILCPSTSDKYSSLLF